MRGLLAEFLRPRKQGFSAPDESWYRAATMEYIRQVLLDLRSLRRSLLRPEYVQCIVNEHASGQRNHRLAIWSLVSTEWRHRIFRDTLDI